MYNGKLVTIRIKNRDPLISINLYDLDTYIDKGGLKLIDKRNNKEIGYFQNVCGIPIEEMMTILGYEIV